MTLRWLGKWLPRPRRERLGWLAVLLLAIVLRFHGLAREGFWLDEVYSARIVNLPAGQIIDHIPQDKPPLDYYAQKFFGHFITNPEAGHRLHSAVAGVLLVLGIYAWARLWFSRRVALTAMLLAACSPFLLYYAREARPYSLFGALIVWQQFLLIAWWRRARAGRATALLGAGAFLLGLAAMYTLYATLLVFAVQAVFLLLAPWVARRHPAGADTPGRISSGRALGLFLLLAGATVLLAWPLKSRTRLHVPEAYFWKFEMSPMLALRFYSEYFLHIVRDPASWILSGLALALAALGLREAWRRNRPAALYLFLLTVLLPPLTTLIYAQINRSYITRYTFFVAPGLLILAALGLRRLAMALAWQGVRLSQRTPGAARYLTLALGALFVTATLTVDAGHHPYRLDWRGVAQHIARNSPGPDQAVVPSNDHGMVLKYYLERLGRPEIRVQTQAERQNDSVQGPAWSTAVEFDPIKARRLPFYGLLVERLGAGPDPSHFVDLAQTLGSGPLLPVGTAPLELLGEGWSQAETWGPNFTIRYITRRETCVYLPLTEEGAAHLTISLMPVAYPGAPPQYVQPTLGGQRLERRLIPAGTFTRLEWAVPPGLARRGLNRLDLALDWVHTPSADRKNYADFRTLAAAVQTIEWRPDAPPR